MTTTPVPSSVRAKCAACGRFIAASDCREWFSGVDALYHPYRNDPQIPCGPVHAVEE